MQNKSVVFLGGNGFIGRNLVNLLSLHCARIYSFDRQLPSVPKKGINYLVGDFFDSDALLSAISGKDIVIHGISTINPSNSNQYYLHGYKNDLLQSIALCEMVSRQGSRMIFLSSGGTVYGDQPVQPIEETAPTAPINHYGAVKVCIETAIRTFRQQMNADMIIARIANPYGPGQDFRKGVGFVDAVLKKGIMNQTIEIWGRDGSIIRDYVYIDDVCKMLIALMSYRGDLDIFNISSGVGISQEEILCVARKTGIPVHASFKKERTVDLRKVILDNTKILSIYKEPLLPFEEGFLRYYEYLIREKPDLLT